MSLRFGPRIPDDSVLKLYKEKVKEKHGRLYAVLGEETEQALKLHLMIKFNVDFIDDPKLIQLLDDYLGIAHTQEQDIHMSDTHATKVLKTPGDCRTKKERAYFAMNYLKRNHLEQITHKDYTKACSNLFGQSDYRTIKTNLDILIINGDLIKIRMRNIGKRNKHKQIYKFQDNNIYNKFNSAKSLEEFVLNFKTRFKDRKQITLFEIKSILEKDYIITDIEFVEYWANHLTQKGLLKKHLDTSRNTIFNIM